MPDINSQYGQSHYDLTLQAYGSLDNAVKLARDNGVLDMDAEVKKVYTYDLNKIVNINNVGYQYGTLASIERVFGKTFNKTFG